MSALHVIITGAGGFVGRSLVEGFAALGWRVTGIDLALDDNAGRAVPGVTLVAADVCNGVLDDLGTADVVLHAAAVTTDPGELGWTTTAHVAANLQPLLAVLAYVERTRPHTLVFLSSSGVFSATDGGTRLTDADVPTSRSAYAVAKRTGEHLVHAAQSVGAAVHVVRLGYLYGPHEAPRATRRRVSLVAGGLVAARAQQPLVVRDDDPWRDWTCTTDLAPALQALIAGPAAGRPVHLASPHVVRDRALATLVARHFPHATIEARPGEGTVKPPMQPSDLPALRAFPWTSPDAGIARLAAAEVTA